MAKVLLVYATRTEETRKIGELVAEGLRIAAVEAVLRNVKDIAADSALTGYDGYVFGSPTYHGDMLQGMKTFLFLAEKAPLAGKVGGAFGAFGWSGEAPERIFETMRNVFQMNMVANALRLKSSLLEGAIPVAQSYGREVAAKVLETV